MAGIKKEDKQSRARSIDPATSKETADSRGTALETRPRFPCFLLPTDRECKHIPPSQLRTRSSSSSFFDSLFYLASSLPEHIAAFWDTG